MEKLTIDAIIQKLNLIPLAGEGGLFAETYRSAQTIPAEALPERYGGRSKPFGTAIFYLLSNDPDSFSAFHRLLSDEVYHFYLGDPLALTLLHPDGTSQTVTMGQDLLNGQQLQVVVPAGVWQGSRLAAGGAYALLGTTMAPGFTPEDYESGQQADLLARYPQEKERILALTRK